MSQRPDPDMLLSRVQAEEKQFARGKLKIFLGAAAGVGKTYAMLQEAQERRTEGLDVAVGYVETHGRVETERLVQGLDLLPRRLLDYRGINLPEFDLDTALARHPTLLLVDELAHTNAPGSRHLKRWQDVDELLHAGISVYTTLNIQHLESLNDVVAQITGIIVRETVPDHILALADAIKLVDLPPDELIQRLHEGKVYVPTQAEKATRKFFRKGNLLALRELALRHVADKVDTQMQTYMRDHTIETPWPTTERMLVGVSSNPLAAHMVRAAARMAKLLRAEWIVAYIETPAHHRLAEADRNRVVQTLRLAEQLGAKTITLSGQSPSEELVAYARAHNVSKIVIGKPARPRWKEILFGSVVDDLARRSALIDIYLISGEGNEPWVQSPREAAPAIPWASYGGGILVVALCTQLARSLVPLFVESNLIMIYLLGVVGVAMRWGQGPSILASLLSVLAFDFFFVPPHLTFAVSDTQYLVTFGGMLLVALVISTLTVQLQQQAMAARQREQRTSALYALSHDIASTRGLENLLLISARHLSETFDCKVAILLPNNGEGHLKVATLETPTTFALTAHEQGVAQWVYDHTHMAGQGTDTLPSAAALYLPLVASQRNVGVLGVCSVQPHRFQAPEQMHLLEMFANQMALSIERVNLAEDAHRAQLQVETERLRNTLLSSVSHDLRTPLATIMGAASGLVEDSEMLNAATRRDLSQAIYEEAEWLNRLVNNLLDMTRLESGTLKVNKEWQPIEEVLGSVLNRLEKQLGQRSITTLLPPDLPPVPLDSVLLEQVLINLLENALKYTPPSSPIDLTVWTKEDALLVEVADRGPGLPLGAEELVFDKFYRAHPNGERNGVGLGLSICRGMIEAHGGQIWAEQRAGGGASFRLSIPLRVSEEL